MIPSAEELKAKRNYTLRKRSYRVQDIVIQIPGKPKNGSKTFKYANITPKALIPSAPDNAFREKV
jgi:hypothetical protein